MRSDDVQLALEMTLLGMFFVALLLVVPAVVLTFTLVGELGTGAQVQDSPLDRFGLHIYLLVFAELAIPIVTLVWIGWGLRRALVRNRASGARD
jgi:hypothetical protein